MHFSEISLRVLSAILLVSLSANVVMGVIILKCVRKNAYLVEMNNVLIENTRLRKAMSEESKLIEEYRNHLDVIDFSDSVSPEDKLNE